MVTVKNQSNINIKQVLHRLGYDDGYEPPIRTLTLVSESIDIAQSLVKPSYSYVIKNVAWADESISLVADFIMFKSQVIAQLLIKCDKVAVFALTIGENVDQKISQLAEDGQVLQASVLDAVGSVITENMADTISDEIGEIALAYGMATSRRFSPGYCDWDIGQQEAVFQALNGNSARVRLTEEYMMLPRKSVSGIIGIGPREVADYNPCNSCDNFDCSGRRLN